MEVTPFVGVWIEIYSIFKGVRADYVTPFVGVWIEIHDKLASSLSCHSHSLRGSVDWNIQLYIVSLLHPSHSLRGSVDWNLLTVKALRLLQCHSLRGSVDWNLQHLPFSSVKGVTPFVGVWIEITKEQHEDRGNNVTPFVGVWIEIHLVQ